MDLEKARPAAGGGVLRRKLRNSSRTRIDRGVNVP